MSASALLSEHAARIIATGQRPLLTRRLGQTCRRQKQVRQKPMGCERYVVTTPPNVSPYLPLPTEKRAQTMRTGQSRSKSSVANDASSSVSGKPAGFTYKLAAAYCGKANQFNPSRQYFSFDPMTSDRWHDGKRVNVEVIPRVKRLSSGQDACFMTTAGTTGAVAFGVADGVGGWQQQGIDSADFAHGMCMYMEEAAQYQQPNAPPLSPLELLRIGYDRVCNDRSIQGGGSTACVAVADEKGMLRVVNLGDSGFMQLRLNKVHHYSDPQTHAFNTPYQLSSLPPKILAQMEIFGGGAPLSDMPDDASVTQHLLEHGDVLVFATDGVWDNLSSQDMLSLISDRMSELHAWRDDGDGTSVTDLLPQLTEEGERSNQDHQQGQGQGHSKPLHAALATTVVQAAKDAGLNAKRDGPFAKAFHRAFPGESFGGGKPDDIAVVVAVVMDPAFVPREPKHGGSKL